MTQDPIVIQDFRSLQPKNRADQQKVIEWIASAHAKSEMARPSSATEEERGELARKAKRLVKRFGSATDRVQFRNSALDDFTHFDWEKMRIFALDSAPSGKGATERSLFFSEVVEETFSRFYAEESEPPAALIHVTCTGYVSPSGAQRLVAKRDWGRTTEVIHAYHMGCYAALPSIRIANGLISAGKSRVDLVHTELCSLHLNPTQRDPEQIVVQTLFSDGLIRYSAKPRSRTAKGIRGLELLAAIEQILPKTTSEMSWMVSDHGMQMSLSRQVPKLVSKSVEPFLAQLAAKAVVSPKELTQDAVFAIHPGGPRLIDEIGDALNLKPHQIAKSNEVLRDYGNMSSATLPHIWKAITEDSSIPENQWVVSMAFGPGLTFSGALFRKTIVA